MPDRDYKDLRAALAASPAALKEYWLFLEAHYDAIQGDTQAALEGLSSLAKVATVTATVFQDPQVGVRRRAMYRKAFVDGDWVPYQEYINAIGKQFAQRGMSFEDYSSLIFKLRRRLHARLQAEWASDPQKLELARQGMELYLGMAMAFIGEGYLQARQEVIRAQEQTIRELSTPVLQVQDRLLILPLIGSLDSQRAQDATQAMLEAIRRERALVLILDVTGVPVVDSAVAMHFTRSAEAARLMGAAILITGISGEMARAMVSLGAELNTMETFANLQAGMERAKRLLAGEKAAQPELVA